MHNSQNSMTDAGMKTGFPVIPVKVLIPSHSIPAIQQIFGVSDHQRSDPYASKIQNFQIQVMWTSQNTRNEDRIKTSQIYSFLGILPEMAEDGGCDPLNHQCDGEEIGGRRRRQRKS